MRKVPWNRRRSSTDIQSDLQWLHVQVNSFATYACTLTELTSDETANIQRLVDDTWRDTNTSFGADATGLRHKTIKIHRVYDIANDALERPYLEALEQSLNNFALPEELVSKPIKTQHVQHGHDQLRHGEVLLGRCRTARQRLARQRIFCIAKVDSLSETLFNQNRWIPGKLG